MLRGIVGGLNGVLNAHVRSGKLEQLRELVTDMVGWAMSYNPPPASMMRLLTRPISGHELTPGLTGGRAPGTLAMNAAPMTSRSRRGLARGKQSSVSRSMVVHSQRERVLDAVANGVAQNGYAALTVEGIAEQAAISLQAFYEHFAGKEDAFLVAYEVGHARGLSIVERAFATQPDWRLGVREGILALFDFLATEPAFAHLALVEALTATRHTAERATDGVAAYAELLIPGVEQTTGLSSAARGDDRSNRWRTVRVVPDLRPARGERAIAGDSTARSYFALAPFIGSEQAWHVATAARAI